MGELLRGEPESLWEWAEDWSAGRMVRAVLVVLAGAGLYGAAMGWWRSPLQALYVAIKFPLILLLVAGGNAVLNAMVAPLLGLNLGFRQCLSAILLSFMIAATILGSCSPLVFFLTWNAPALSPDGRLSGGTYSLMMVTHVAAIAFAGVASNLRLGQLLARASDSARSSRLVLLAWLSGNLLLGTQLCWIFRPFIGSPDLPIQFLRPTAFQGNFFEALWRSVSRLLNLQ